MRTTDHVCGLTMRIKITPRADGSFNRFECMNLKLEPSESRECLNWILAKYYITSGFKRIMENLTV